MADAPLVVSPDALKRFILAVFARWGTPPSVAELTADLMVTTDLRGVDTHGIGMLPTYLRWYRAGYIVPAAELMTLPHDMIGISLTNGPWPAVVPTFGRQAVDPTARRGAR